MKFILRLGLIISVIAVNGYTAAEEVPAFISASSSYAGEYSAHYALDGDMTSRWASADGSDGQWLAVDLGEVVALGDIKITWEQAYARGYEIQYSADGGIWQSLCHITEGQGGENVVAGNGVQARHIRVLCHIPGPFNTFSIWEIAFLDAGNAAALQRQWLDFERQEKMRANEQRKTMRAALSQSGVQEIVFVARALYTDGHWYANISYFAEDVNRKTYVKGSRLQMLDLASDTVRTLIDDPDGTIRDPAVHYDGKTILFSWRRENSETFHLYTVQSDGTGLTQLTRGDYDDFEPAWLPDGGIVFVSTRCRRWVNCWLTQVATLHRCDADGGNVHPLSANLEQDNTPWPMPDGRILYTRWEYVDRSQVDYHHLWTMNPDGTGQMTYFGNMHPPDLYIDAKPVPGTEEVIFINSPGHGAKEHVGHVALVHTRQGPDHLPALRNITDNGYRDPYAVAENVFLAAQGRNIVLLNRDGGTAIVYRLDRSKRNDEIHEPRPLIARDPEPVIPRHTDYAKTTGRLILSDVYTGRNMDGVQIGDIAKLLVMESLPKPINYTGGMDPLSYGGTFTLERILGEIPVESDGSAYMEVPANRSLFFIAMDKDNNAIKRMQSFLTVMPGETLGCVGCHEERVIAPNNAQGGTLAALKRPPSRIRELAHIPDVFDFPRDIQPILDKHCVKCHDYAPHEGAEHGPRAGGVILSGDRGPMFSHSYASLAIHRQIADGRNRAVSNYPPRSLGASASPLMHKIQEHHHDVHLSSEETDMVRYWIESGAAYPGTYGALGAGSIGGYHENQQIETDYFWPESMAASRAISEQCIKCHQNEKRLPLALSDENDLSFWRPEWDDPRLLRSRHLAFNLSRPELSLMLLAPLARESGGYGRCTAPDETGAMQSIFPDTQSPTYQAILAMICAGKNRLETIKRFDMKDYQPPAPYIREMIRYGVLPLDHDWQTPVNTYLLDRSYWDSFRQEVALQHPAYDETGN